MPDRSDSVRREIMAPIGSQSDTALLRRSDDVLAEATALIGVLPETQAATVRALGALLGAATRRWADPPRAKGLFSDE